VTRLAALLWLGLALPALATQDRWPALFDVTGVAADDVLNIRAAPSAQADIVGSLAPDATAVEVIAPSPRQDWGRVNTAEGSGWVSMAFLQRRPGQWLGALPEVTRCFGTEPFWTLDIDEQGALAFTRPDMADATGQRTIYIGSNNRRDRFALAGTLRDGAVSGAMIQMVGTSRLEQCSDGMSDRRYGISVDLVLGAGQSPVLYSGCCTLAPQ
jgi:uncharacterized membrane protein